MLLERFFCQKVKKHVEARMQFAMDHINWDGRDGMKKFRNLLWSNETKINLRGLNGNLSKFGSISDKNS